MRSAATGTLLTLYVLAGRWSVDRLFREVKQAESYLSYGLDTISLYELRFWIVAGLLVVLLFQPRATGTGVVKRGARNFSMALYFFYFYLFATALWAPDGSFAFQKSWELMLIVLTSVCVRHATLEPQGPDVREWFWRTMVAITGLMAVMATVKAATSGAERLAVLGGGPNIFGRMMALLAVGCLYFWRRRGGPFFIGLGVLSALLIVLSGSRGSMLSTLVAVCAFFFYEKIDARRLSLAAGFAAIVGGAALFGTPMGRNAIATYETRVNQLMIKEGHTSGRTDIYKDALELGGRYPIFGAGLAAFPGLGLGVYPHNLFLEVFCENGGLGLTLLALLFGLFTKAILLDRTNVDGAAVAAFLVIFATAQFSGDLYDSRALFMFMMMAYIPRNV